MIGQQGNMFSVQVMGRYKVSNEGLRRLYTRVKKVQKSFESFQIEHVFRWAGDLQEPAVLWSRSMLPKQGHIDSAVLCCRGKNQVADELSNQAVDTSGWQGLKDMQVVMRTC